MSDSILCPQFLLLDGLERLFSETDSIKNRRDDVVNHAQIDQAETDSEKDQYWVYIYHQAREDNHDQEQVCRAAV